MKYSNDTPTMYITIYLCLCSLVSPFIYYNTPTIIMNNGKYIVSQLFKVRFAEAEALAGMPRAGTAT